MKQLGFSSSSEIWLWLLCNSRWLHIIDDKVDVEEVADAFKYWYDKTPKQRKEAGLKGREAFLGDLGLNSKNQNKCMADGIEKAIKNFKPKPRYKLHKLR